METPRLDRIRVWVKRRLRIWALVVNGETEVGEFLDRLAREDPQAITSWVLQFDQIGQRDHFVGEKWFKQMAGWPDQWEVRRGDHRLMGFRVGDDLILCLHRVKHKAMADPADLARIDRLAREWRAQHGTAMGS